MPMSMFDLITLLDGVDAATDRKSHPVIRILGAIACAGAAIWAVITFIQWLN